MAGNTVALLVGGIGGLVADKELRRRLDLDDRVILTNRTGKHLFAPSLLWVMEGSRRVGAFQPDPGRLRRRTKSPRCSVWGSLRSSIGGAGAS